MSTVPCHDCGAPTTHPLRLCDVDLDTRFPDSREGNYRKGAGQRYRPQHGPGTERFPWRRYPALEREIAAIGAHGGRELVRGPLAPHCLACGGPCQFDEHEGVA